MVCYVHRNEVKKDMTEKEYKLACEVEKLKKEIKQKDNKIKDLEAQKKTFVSKLKIQSEQYEDLKKNFQNCVELKRKNELLKDEIKSLKNIIEQKDSAIEALKARVNKNSSNSSKPSSTDGFKKKIHNCREKSNKPKGGQLKHKGSTLQPKEPSEIVEKKVTKCECGGIVKQNKTYTAKQLIDVEIIVKVIEERVYEGKCKKCGKKHKAKFSKEFKNPAQYGNNLKALVGMLVNEEYVAIDRCSSFIKEITKGNITLSNGTIVNITKELSKKSEKTIEDIKNKLLSAPLNHSDETGIRINGKQHWLHTLCNKDHVFYGINKKRGKDALEEMELIKFFTGILMHDHFKPYYNYEQITHAECNAHVLRYLKSVIELFHRKETEAFLEFLVRINNRKKEAIEAGLTCLEDDELLAIESEYIKLLNDWKSAYFEYVKNLKNINQPLKEERCLFERLLEYHEEHLRFIKNFDVPFDNNLAERALRLIKTKKNVSGGFRSEQLANAFCNIRSLIGSAKKQGLNVFETLKQLLCQQNLDIIKI